MGLFSSLMNLGRGAGKGAQPVPLAAGEQELKRVVASLRPGSVRSVGGDLVLTTARVFFTPLDVRDLAVVLAWGLGRAGAGPASRLPGVLAGQVGGPADVSELGDLADVRAGSGPSMLKPPTLLLIGKGGAIQEFGILATRTSANVSKRNVAARDEMLTAIRATLGA